MENIFFASKYFFRVKIFSPLQELEAALLPQLANLSQLELVRDSGPGRWRLDSEWSGPVLHQTPCQDGGRGEAALLASWPPLLIHISDKGVLAGVIISVVITTILLSLGLCTFVRYFLR